jgi:hypothetical protein
MAAYGNKPVPNSVLNAVMAARDDAEVTNIINSSLGIILYFSFFY